MLVKFYCPTNIFIAEKNITSIPREGENVILDKVHYEVANVTYNFDENCYVIINLI